MKYSIIAFFFFTSCLGWAQSDQEKVLKTVQQSTLKKHIYTLADDSLKGRKTGTPENKTAASYLANTLASYGVQPNPLTGTYYQGVPLEIVQPNAHFFLSFNEKEHKNKALLKPRNLNVSEQAVFAGYGLEEDYQNTNVTKKIVIVKGGQPEETGIREAFGLRQKKWELAKEAGAIALIELIETNSTGWGYVNRRFNTEKIQIADPDAAKNTVAHIWIQDEYGALAAEFKEEAPIVQTKLGVPKGTPVPTQNVVGILPGTDPVLKNEYVVFTAHYDHVGIGKPDKEGDSIYNGARDNAVGVTTVLSMAENLAKYPTKRSAVFLLLTAEEEGLLGSTYFVDHPVIPLEEIVYCINSDNGGYNDTSIATIVGLNRTTASGLFVEASEAFGLMAAEDPVPEQGLFDRSDNVNFAKKGIPAPTFSMGFTAFDESLLKYYHQPADEADDLDYAYLEKFFKAYVLAGRLILNTESSPFWISGDPYEEAGKKLYENK